MSEKLTKTVGAIKELVSIFKTERQVYLIITVLSVLILVVTCIWLLTKEDGSSNTAAVFGLFGPAGAITYTSGRLLKMWSEAMLLIQKVVEQDNE